MTSHGSVGGGSSRNLISLAPEIVENVIKQVSDKSDLSNARLVCKAFNTHAAKELFKNVFISPLQEHINSWNSISHDEDIRQLPRHAIVHTHSNVESNVERDSFGRIMETRDNDDGLEHALTALSRFPNLDSMHISFTPECRGEHETLPWEKIVEDVPPRERLLTLIFRAINNRAANKQNRTICYLTIVNLQNCPIPSLTSSDLFHEVMGQLKELHISITQERDERVPDRALTWTELRTLPAHFCSEWLEPVSGNLKALSIYHREDNWGPFPRYFDFSRLSFPRLETLALGYYTLAHENDLDWILEWILAIKALRKLVLHNCMIASKIRLGSKYMNQWNVRSHDWIRLPDNCQDGWTTRFVYGGKWSHCLNRIANDLPNLVDFRFDQASPYATQHDGP